MDEVEAGSNAAAAEDPGARGVWVGQGARRVEARLLAEVRAWHEAARAEPARLGRPLHVLVPSRSLKDHVSAVLVRELGTLAGVAVQTHFGLALQILERAGRRAPHGAPLVPVLVRQAAGREPVLARALERLEDGYGAVAEAVSDLLDAGLEPAHAEAVEELLGSGGGPAWARAAGVARVALAVREALGKAGLGRMSDLLPTAQAEIEAQPELVPAGRLLVHGFADATGLVADFLGALVRGRDALVLMDRPPDPASPDAPDLGAEFVRPLRDGLATVTGAPPVLDPEPAEPPRLRFFRAPGSDAEVRAVVRQVVALIDDGVAPESIGIVTRTPALYAAPLRIVLERLGVPASGVAVPGARSPLGRRIAFVLELLRRGAALPADRFVLALGRLHPGDRDDLRLGLHALGVARLGDLAGLDVAARFRGEGRFPLPVRRGLASGAHDGEAEAAEEAPEEPRRREPLGPHAPRRHLARETLAETVGVAGDVVAWLDAAAIPGPLGERLAGLAGLLTDTLGWRRPSEVAPLVARLDALADELPRDHPVTTAELGLVLERALGPLAYEPLGGAGGGVQLLDVVEARARTFAHLFLLGLNRDHFPRVISEDPLLPDAVRQALGAVLPELPVKARGHEEERYLFAELVSASPEVTISWQILGDDGKAKAPSPLVDRLVAPGTEVPRVATALAPAELEAREHTAHEWAVLAGMHGTRPQARALLPEALAEARDGDAAGVAEIAGVRSRVVQELDAYEADAPLLGPFLGHVGPPREAQDLRQGDLWVTHLEAVARCPWQGFLSRMLRLERPPDALEALPEASPLLVGSLVHAVLQKIVEEVVPEPPPEDRVPDALGVPVPWPDAEVVDRLLEREAERLLFEDGIGVPGFPRLLAHVARPYLDAARGADWAEAPPRVVGAEVETSVALPGVGGPRRLRFRADRIDRIDRTAEGLRLTDYKTGAPPSDSLQAQTRDRNLLRSMRRGKTLQAATYARLAPGATGRFLFVRPDVADPAREYAVGPDDATFQAAFEESAGRVLAALDEGTFPPRLVATGGDDSDVCRTCELTVACLHGDSGARRRLAEWRPGPGDDPRAEALRRIWALEEDD